MFTSQAMQTYIKGGFDGKEASFENKVQIVEKEIDFTIKILPTTFDDGIIGLTWILQDITARKQAEEE